MRKYYLEKYEEATTKLALARIGYEREIKVLACKLGNEDESNHALIIAKICSIRNALDEMITEAKAYKIKYEVECEKDGALNATDSK